MCRLTEKKKNKKNKKKKEEFQYDPASPYHPDNWHKPEIVSKEDMEYLKGEPAPLKITIPITIEKDDVENS